MRGVFGIGVRGVLRTVLRLQIGAASAWLMVGRRRGLSRRIGVTVDIGLWCLVIITLLL